MHRHHCSPALEIPLQKQNRNQREKYKVNFILEKSSVSSIFSNIQKWKSERYVATRLFNAAQCLPQTLG
jgi:hypothetical protein